MEIGINNNSHTYIYFQIEDGMVGKGVWVFAKQNTENHPFSLCKKSKVKNQQKSEKVCFGNNDFYRENLKTTEKELYYKNNKII